MEQPAQPRNGSWCSGLYVLALVAACCLPAQDASDSPPPEPLLSPEHRQPRHSADEAASSSCSPVTSTLTYQGGPPSLDTPSTADGRGPGLQLVPDTSSPRPKLSPRGAGGVTKKRTYARFTPDERNEMAHEVLRALDESDQRLALDGHPEEINFLKYRSRTATSPLLRAHEAMQARGMPLRPFRNMRKPMKRWFISKFKEGRVQDLPRLPRAELPDDRSIVAPLQPPNLQ